MLLRLQKFNIQVEYHKGDEMYVADTLSRASLPLRGKDSSKRDKDEHIFSVEISNFQEELEEVNVTESLNVSEQRLAQIQNLTMQDTELHTLKTVILYGWPETRDQAPQACRDYWNFRDELTIHNGILFKGNRVIIPKLMRPEMLARIHSSHMGAEASLRKARDALYWPNMSSDIREHTQKCSVCRDYDRRQEREPLITHDVPSHPWSKIGVDLFTIHQKSYLVTVDYYTDFWELDELLDTTADTVINCLKQHCSRHGTPDKLMSDNGPQFTSSEFSKFSREWEITHTTSSPYHSQSNGKAESAVKIAKNILKKCKKSGEDQWKAILDWRNTPTEGIGSSPVQRLMSRRTKGTLPIAMSLLQPEVVEGTHVDKRKQCKQQRTKLYYDRRAKELPPLTVGEPVRLLPQERGKPWQLGTCVGQAGRRSYIVDVGGRQYRRNRVHLRPSHEAPVHKEPLDNIGEKLCNPNNPEERAEMQPVDIPVIPSSDADKPRTTRSGRTVREPQRMDLYRTFTRV